MDCVWSKPNPMPESVTDRPTKSHEYLFLLSKSPRYYYDSEAIKEQPAPQSLARIRQPNFANQKGGPKDYRVTGINPNRSMRQTLENFALNPGRNKRSVWTVATAPYAEAHFATFPPALIEPCILAGTSPAACEHCGAPWTRIASREFIPQQDVRDPAKLAKRSNKGMDASNSWGDTPRGTTRYETTGWQPTCRCENNTGAGKCVVLDPFLGSGTVAAVAKRHSRRWLGIELNPAYVELAERRIAKEVQPVLWSTIVAAEGGAA